MVTFTRRARAAQSTLDQAEREDLAARIERLGDAWPSCPSGEDVIRLAADEPLWALKYGDLRIIFRAAAGGIEVLDLMPRQRVYG